MSIASEISRLLQAKADIKIAIEGKGVTVSGSATLDDYSDLIDAIQQGGGGGGGASSGDDVRFLDYDGTILHSYSASDFLALTEMPENPSHEGLTAQGWNWTLADAKAHVQAMGTCDIGQMYITESGKTEIDVHFPDSARLSPIMTIAVNGTVTVDWGDNTTPDTVTGSSLTTSLAVPHTYSKAGDYTIKITPVSGSFTFFGDSTHTILRKKTTANENRVYSNCVQSIRVGSGVTSIGNYAFSNCYSLASITIPSGVTSIGNNAFYNCSSLASIAIPSGVTSIRNYAFQNCYSLASITIPSGVTSIGNYAFYNCYSLASITIPSGVTSIGEYAFSNCSSLASIAIPSGVTSIGEYAFSNCYSLASITIPSGVTSIENNAFSNCYSLASITIPSGVTSIRNYAFQNCYGMAEYHLLPTTPPSLGGTNVFQKIVSDCKIYVPTESLEAYKSAQYWSTHASKMVGE